ncbi:hypothetical protein RchiOBHm_Chr4g0419581 [Rosa chinensis]|uniref:Uncharacterized protein n=1 Tax=Rosa chinensis TaxID=74649 RepID=A0A2P6QXT4_ROSCH|nr:hypothetical protein RchiOBHm_Chr4g0419581 [Rosa chinensis]
MARENRGRGGREGSSSGGEGIPRGGGSRSSHWGIAGRSRGSSEGSSRGASARVERPVVSDVPDTEEVEVLEIPRTPRGRLLLGETPIDQPGPSMMEEQIAKLRATWAIPESVLLRLLREGEVFSHPPLGCASFYEYQLRCGLTFPLPEELQYLLSCLNIAVGQLSPNALRQIMGVLLLWKLSKLLCPSIGEFNSLFKLSDSTKRGDSGCVNFRVCCCIVIKELPSNIYSCWRGWMCLVGGRWQNPDMVHRAPSRFQSISFLCVVVRQEVKLTTLEMKRMARVMGAFPRGFYRLCRLPIYERFELGRSPGEGFSFCCWCVVCVAGYRY